MELDIFVIPCCVAEDRQQLFRVCAEQGIEAARARKRDPARRQTRQHVVERFAVGKADPPGETPGVEPRCADCEPEAFVVETVVVAAAAVVLLFHGGVDFGDLCAAPVKIRTRTTVCLPNGRLWKTFVAVSAYSPRRNDVGIISRAIRRRPHRKAGYALDC